LPEDRSTIGFEGTTTMADNNSKMNDFQMIVVTMPEKQYFAMDQDDIKYCYKREPGTQLYKQLPREPLKSDDPLVKDWQEFVTRDVQMAHKQWPNNAVNLPTFFGTFLVNFASFKPMK
jgi:hypothetical protein